ncbi:O-antigen ligase family protein [Fodinicola acaciae]|uniref:O-antigen ligase family protein n=1 Tax=Fodinicola acaciae TaxID=2681555 RepID=UPI0013D376FF|nr:O-antigen ligase family protein [Fodinicola acaciae]
MTTADLAPTAKPAPATDPRPLSPPISRALSTIILVLLGALLVDVLFEGWIQQLFGHAGPIDPKTLQPTWVLADWPKDVKSALFLALLAFTLLKVAIDQSWRDFLTKAELALAALGVIMVASGLLGGSGLTLIGQALFVYFRGVIVFFAWRAVRPTMRQLKPIFYVVGAIAVVNATIAIVESMLGYPIYKLLGWTDLTWANINRAHALLNHPNHLGHFLMVIEIGLMAWFTTRDRISKKHWFLFGLLAWGMAATQSRESAIGFVLGIAVIWWLRRKPVRPLVFGLIVVVLFSGLQLVATPSNVGVLAKRILGVFNAFQTPSGQETEGTSSREIRVLFYQQGLGLYAKKPVLGYGVGQFGGTVAYQANPKWYEKFNFRLHGAKPDQVDSFWLHLLVETGALGFLAYLIWLFFLVAPMVRSRTRGPDVSPFVLWGPPVVVAAILSAFLSPLLEDQLFPVLLFTVLGLGWSTLRRGDSADAIPATLLAGPAHPVTALHRPAVLPAGVSDDHLTFTWRRKPTEKAGQDTDDRSAPGGAEPAGEHRGG